ncbi:LOW QUALITY PROTEIN: LIM and calponin homology domains-containing protein 1 [Brachyhypopomus gauderio]|uniref:LOW QUALITY PROTEIN: LIM and calponin homology domains-containing protein 1 n=1 Tax=Brachyhypopomus gauderio TaxID=698409 RepID=UPI004042B65B
MRKEGEECDSPRCSIRDSGYIDCWESERSDSLSPPRHARDDSFDSLDSIGSRSRHTPSPDGLLARGYSDGRGSDSECDVPHRKLPDVRRDDMLARRTSCSEPRSAVPFNQYLPNKSNQTAYVPASLRRQHTDREDNRKSWSNATSPTGGERPFSSPAHSCSEELRTSLTTSSMATSIIVTSPPSPSPQASPGPCRKFPPPITDQEGRASPTTDSGKDDMWARRSQISPKHGSPSPTHFLPVPSSTNQTARPGKAGSETEKSQRRPSWLDDDPSPTFSHTASLSDDTESVSMIDMRGEDDATLAAHSQVRHELLHDQYTRMKEEENHWQDDLARWKSRRRSVSQDLIKKEETRKMMEKLLNREDCSERRKSIKTYREIVQDKERRERELHEAYLRAKTPEEAAAVLHRYAQRFTISEAIMERLQLPRVLGRSVSADPSRGPPSPSTPEDSPFSPTGSGPLRYLRQQSLPAPKFTSTLEALVKSCGSQQDAGGTHGGRAGEERVNGDADPGLAGGKGRQRWAEREKENDGKRKRKGESSPLFFYPSSSQNTHPDGTEAESSGTHATAHTPTPPPEAELPDRADLEMPGSAGPDPQSREVECPPSRPTFLLMVPIQEEAVLQAGGVSPPLKEEEPRIEELPGSVRAAEEREGVDPAVVTQNTTQQAALDPQVPSRTGTTANQISEPVLECPQRTLELPEPAGQLQPDQTTRLQQEPAGQLQPEPACQLQPEQTARLQPEQTGKLQPEPTSQLQPEQTGKLQPEPAGQLQPEPNRQLQPDLAVRLRPAPKPACRTPTTELASNAQLAPLSSNPKLRWDFFTSSEPAGSVHKNVAPAVLSLVKRGEPFAWDPEEERERQARWQREQERMLQERYHREQEKLKQEWEKAQKEVEEEERRYHEEERKILEETVAPLTPHSPLPPSPCWLDSTPLTGTTTPQAIVRSLADWERKQQELENQTKETLETKTQRQQETKETEGQSWATSSLQTDNCDRPADQRSGQRADVCEESKAVQPGQDVSWSNKQHQQKPSSKDLQQTASLDSTRNTHPASGGRKRSDSVESVGVSQSPSHTDTPQPPPSPNRSVSGKKLCSSCGHPLGKGAAMIIETLSLYFHIQCFKCGICKGQLGDTTTGTDVRIRNGLLNCHQCYIRSRSAGQPTTL